MVQHLPCSKAFFFVTATHEWVFCVCVRVRAIPNASWTIATHISSELHPRSTAAVQQQRPYNPSEPHRGSYILLCTNAFFSVICTLFYGARGSCLALSAAGHAGGPPACCRSSTSRSTQQAISHTQSSGACMI